MSGLPASLLEGLLEDRRDCALCPENVCELEFDGDEMEFLPED